LARLSLKLHEFNCVGSRTSEALCIAVEKGRGSRRVDIWKVRVGLGTLEEWRMAAEKCTYMSYIVATVRRARRIGMGCRRVGICGRHRRISAGCRIEKIRMGCNWKRIGAGSGGLRCRCWKMKQKKLKTYMNTVAYVTKKVRLDATSVFELGLPSCSIRLSGNR